MLSRNVVFHVVVDSSSCGIDRWFSVVKALRLNQLIGQKVRTFDSVNIICSALADLCKAVWQAIKSAVKQCCMPESCCRVTSRKAEFVRSH